MQTQHSRRFLHGAKSLRAGQQQWVSARWQAMKGEFDKQKLNTKAKRDFHGTLFMYEIEHRSQSARGGQN